MNNTPVKAVIAFSLALVIISSVQACHNYQSGVEPKIKYEPYVPLEITVEANTISDDVPVVLDLSIPTGSLYSRDWVTLSRKYMNHAGVVSTLSDRASLTLAEELLDYRVDDDETLVDVLSKIVTQEIGGLGASQAYGSVEMEYSAVVWCILNRVDAEGINGNYAERIVTQAKRPNQFAYYKGGRIAVRAEEVVIDTLVRWCIEKAGKQAGRVLPSEYLYFTGDGKHNNYTTEWRSGETWDWSLPDPYISN